MSESKANLEQILELLLAEENEKAEELLHEYVVGKARSEYEKVLDEAEATEDEEAVDETVETEEDAVEETISQDHDFVDDISANADEVDAEEEGRLGEDDLEGEEGEDEFDGEAGEVDIEDKVDDLEAELEDLRAEFEKLLGGDDEEAGDEEGDELDLEAPVDAEFGGEEEFESFEYDIEESTDEDNEVVEEATKLSDAVATPSAPGEDSKESSLTKAPAQPAVTLASPVKAKDGGEGKKGDAAKDNTPTDNIKVDSKNV
jgi:hypothetical protein|tara:strand:+ start:335 stop:1114 length:780 start_codon:yes stop_codon:yes gene_type:complete